MAIVLDDGNTWYPHDREEDRRLRECEGCHSRAKTYSINTGDGHRTLCEGCGRDVIRKWNAMVTGE